MTDFGSQNRCLLGALFMKKSIKNTYVFSARFKSLFFPIFMWFLPIFDDFWDAKSTSKTDLRYFRKTFKTMILSSKSRVWASPKPEKVTPKTFKKHACVSNLFFSWFYRIFHDFWEPFWCPNGSKNQQKIDTEIDAEKNSKYKPILTLNGKRGFIL